MTFLGSWTDRAGSGWSSRASASAWMAVVGLASMAIAAAGLAAGERGLLALAGLAVAVPLAIALCHRPQRGVILLVALAPFDGLRLVLPLPSSAADWKEVLVIATLVATFLAPPEARAARDRLRYPPWLSAVAGLIALGLVSAVLVGGQQAVTGFRIDYFYVLLAIAVWRCPLGEGERDRLVSVLMVTGFLTAVWGIGQQVLGENWLNSIGYQYGGPNATLRTIGPFLRSFSTFTGDDAFGFFLMAVLLVGVPCALSDTRRLRNKLFFACLPVLTAGLILSFFRGGWLGVIFGGLYLGIRRHRVLLLAVPAAVLALFLVPGSVLSTGSSTTSLGERTAGWVQNFDQVVSHPLGIGIGATGAAAIKVAEMESQAQSSGQGNSAINTSIPGSSVYEPDNYYYEAAYDLGLPGLWLWILLMVSSFLVAARLADSTSGMESGFALGVAAFVLAAAVCSFFATFFEVYPMDVLFWLFISMTVSGHPVSDLAVRRDSAHIGSLTGGGAGPRPNHGTP